MFVEDRKFHDVANIFPLMGKEEFDGLKNDISQNGLREAIWTDKDGAIIDGKNRYLACKDIGIEPQYQTYDGDGLLTELVISLNLNRRHLTDGQKAFIAISIEPHLAKEAKERQREAGRLHGQNHPKAKDVTPNAEAFNSFEKEGQEVIEKIQQPLPQQKAIDRTAVQKAAKMVGTNYHYVSDAKRIAATAPDVADVVRLGKIGMPDAVKIAKLAEPLRKEILMKVKDGTKPTDAIRESVRATIKAELEGIETRINKEINGVYDVIVIDPPWPMRKIDRDVSPTQVEFPYPTMTLHEIGQVKIPCADDCHVWLWTTQKFLPDAFEIIKSWGLQYRTLFVWHKPGGFQPFAQPQYNCEFALYCTKGTPKFIDTKDFPTCFNAPRCRHSEKPDIFYEFAKRVTAGRRLDMFNRREIDGFDTWGKEAV
jgi:N6-adenosine-specific RNA methylase IME4